MSKRSSFKIKEEILKLSKTEKTLAELERKINTGFNTIKSNCEELEKFGFIKMQKYQKHQKNGKPFFKVSLTESGRNLIKR